MHPFHPISTHISAKALKLTLVILFMVLCPWQSRAGIFYQPDSIDRSEVSDLLKELGTAIKNNDLNTAIQILDEKSLIRNGKNNTGFHKFFISHVKDPRFAPYGELFADDGTCRYELVDEFIKRGYIDPNEVIDLAVAIPCPDTVDKLLPLSSDKQALEAASKYIYIVKRKIGSPGDLSEEQGTKYAYIYKSLKMRALSICQKKGESPETSPKMYIFREYETFLRETAKKEQENEESRQRSQEYFNSPRGIFDEACNIKSQIDEYKAQLAKEEKIENAGGVVDLSKRRYIGERLVKLQEELDGLASAYKAKTAKNLPLTQCK